MTTATVQVQLRAGPGRTQPSSFVLGQHFADIRLVRLVRFGSVRFGWFNQRYDIMRFASRYIAL